MLILNSSKFCVTELEYVGHEEKVWIDSLNSAFNNHYVMDENNYEIFGLSGLHIHHEFNPFGRAIFYVQESHVGELETTANTRGTKIYYINQPIFRPTGTFSMNHGLQIITCKNGYLHNASGNPAIKSSLFGPEYYLYGENYKPIDYFRFMEEQKSYYRELFSYRYPEYESKKYVEFMAGLLGCKE